MESHNMLSTERRLAINNKIKIEKRLLISDLQEEFSTSVVTIRKDLDILEKKGVLTRVHGGALLNEVLGGNLSIGEKEKIHFKEKERIAIFAESLIKEGDVVILDSGFTAIHIARRLKMRSGIIVITNGLNVANEIADSNNELIIIGGVFDKNTFGNSGKLAENVINNSVADKLFLGVNGIDFEIGLTAHNHIEAELNKLMIKVSTETTIIADSSKFGRRRMGFISKFENINRIITDKSIDPKYVEEAKKFPFILNIV